MTFWQNIFFAIWFFLPAGFANLFPIFAAQTPILRNWKFPMDFYGTFRGKRILGDNKTIRGLIIGILFGIAVAYVQKHLYVNWDYLRSILPIDYSAFNPLYLGALLGMGALAGDAVKSFFKRQMNIPSGDSWFFFDQLDYVVGVVALTYFYVPLSIKQYLYIAVVWFILHILTTTIAYWVGLKQKAI